MPYGIHSAQEVFHKRVSQNFDGISQVETDIDDILVWGKEDVDHDHYLIKCLEKAKKIGMTININKCQFKSSELVYLGHKLTSNGIEPDQQKKKVLLVYQYLKTRKEFKDCWVKLIMWASLFQTYQKRQHH